jgi:hypothetical protein
MTTQFVVAGAIRAGTATRSFRTSRRADVVYHICGLPLMPRKLAGMCDMRISTGTGMILDVHYVISPTALFG